MEYEKIDCKTIDSSMQARDFSRQLTEQMGREIAKAYDQGFQTAAGMDTAKKIEDLLIELRTLRADKERLDWLEKANGFYRRHDQQWSVVGAYVGEFGLQTTLRAAIDAAKEKT